MASCAFLVGTRCELAKLLNIPYGYIAIEACGNVVVYSQDIAKRALSQAVSDSLITADNAGALEKAITEAGILPTMAAVMDLARQFVLPADHKTMYRFEVCHCAKPLPHGSIVDFDGSQIIKGFVCNLEVGFHVLDGLVFQLSGKLSALDAVAVFHEMVAAGLPQDAVAEAALYAALPEPVRQAYEKREGSLGRLSETLRLCRRF